MLRYFLVSAILVLGFAVLVTGWVARDLIRIRIAAALGDVKAKPEAFHTAGAAPVFGLRGDAPWALSALPECVIQTSVTTGPRAYVLAHLPRAAAPVSSHAVLHYGNCTVTVDGNQAYVARGPDRFRIPPVVRLYRAPGALAVLREDGVGNELRVYGPPDSDLH